jgi:hypothetical protein
MASLQDLIVPENLIRLSHKDLLDLRVQVGFGFLYYHKVERRNDGTGSRDIDWFVTSFANPHPSVPERHEPKDHRNQVLVAQAVVVLWKTH